MISKLDETPTIQCCRLPLELVELIMDHLHDDPTMLRTCSLVCKCWLPSSRYHVFGTVTLELFSQRLRRFIELLSSVPSCTFFASVRHIEVDGKHAKDPSDDEKSFQELLTALVSSVYLSGVQSLTFRNLNWTIYPMNECAGIASQFARFTQLRRLEMFHVTFHDLREVIRILNAFPTLSHLFASIHFLKYPEYVVADAKTLRFPQNLDVVDIRSEDGVSKSLDCLSAAQRDPHLSSTSSLNIYMHIL